MFCTRELDFLILFGAQRNARLMARIVLNRLSCAVQFPVDVSELRELSQENRDAIRLFLDTNHVNPLPLLDEPSFRAMTRVARTPADVWATREQDKGDAKSAEGKATSNVVRSISFPS
ncbi:MAG: hypothetical protein AMXMBFR59_12240 [Rhodanobacteraceae bacterium]